MNHQNTTLMIVHIPKCAGTTLRTIMERQYTPQQIYKIGGDIAGDQMKLHALQNGNKRIKRVVFGHYHYGLHVALCPGQDFEYITMLRDPVARVVSLYSYTRTEAPAHYLAKPAREMSLHEFITSGVTRQVDNGMVRQLCGEDAFTMQAGRQVPYDDCKIGWRELTRDHLEMAKRNLETFALVGFAHQFDTFLDQMRARFSWRIPMYRRRNVSRERIQPTTRDTKAITELNQLDFELYHWALNGRVTE